MEAELLYLKLSKHQNMIERIGPSYIKCIPIGDGSLLQIEIDEILGDKTDDVRENGHTGQKIMPKTYMSGFRIFAVNRGTGIAFNGQQSPHIADQLLFTINSLRNGPSEEIEVKNYPDLKVKKLNNGKICIVHQVIVSSENVVELIDKLEEVKSLQYHEPGQPNE